MKNFKLVFLHIIFCLLLSVAGQKAMAQDTWTQKASYGGITRFLGVSFSIGNKGYFGTGIEAGTLKKDFWEYDPANDVWTQKADFGGAARQDAVGFGIDSLGAGYIGGGDSITSRPYQDMWKYDVSSNTWVYVNAVDMAVYTVEGAVSFCIGTQAYICGGYQYSGNGGGTISQVIAYDAVHNTWSPKAVYPAFGGIHHGIGFSIGTKGYVGVGASDANINGTQDFYEYDQATDTWTQKAAFGGTARKNTIGFSIGNKGYVGTGIDLSNNAQSDLWVYDPAMDNWSQTANMAGAARYGGIGFSIGGKGYIGLGGNNINYPCDVWQFNPAANNWTQKSNVGSIFASTPACFTIGNKAYLGTGNAGGTPRKDFWQYDQATGFWTQVADFGGAYCYSDVGFSAGGKGYVCMGVSNSTLSNQLYEYDAAANTWTRKSDFPGTARTGAVAFGINTMGYMGTGGNMTDFWQYDPAMDTWTRKADFAGTARNNATGFSIAGKGYIGTGFDTTYSYKNDFWEYDPANDTWTAKADFAGNGRYSACGFAIGNKAYLGTGLDSLGNYTTDFWEYDQSVNGWTQKPDFGGTGRFGACGFSLGNRGYIAMGSSSTAGLNDLWEYAATVIVPLPPTPNLLSPADLATNVSLTPVFSWDSVANAAGYELQVSTTNNFNSTIIDQSGLTNLNFVVAPALNNNTVYYWRVRATNATGTGGWSNVWSFTTTLNIGVSYINSAAPLLVYPNPAFSYLVIDAGTTQQRLSVKLCDINGRMIYETKPTSVSVYKLFVADLVPGTYSVTIGTDTFTHTELFVKE